MEIASSCKKSRTPRPKKDFVDRLSHLPDDILHRIFSHLDFLDVVRTSVLSKRWRNAWASAPYLNFDMAWYEIHNYGSRFEFMEPHYKFWDFIKWSFLLRDGSQIIRICLDADNTISEQLNGLIRVASRLKVQELCFPDGDYTADNLDFPRGLCETLTVLTVNFQDTIPLRVVTAFCSLRRLSLTRVVISRDAAEKLFSSGCVKLESVFLEDCQVKDIEQIDISACNLKDVAIVNACTCERFWVVGAFDCRLRICAPNLLSFYYYGPMLRGFDLENVASLRNITIRLLRIPRRFMNEQKNHLLCPASCIGLNNAKSLTLSTVVKYFCPTFNEVSWDAFMLDNVSHLELELRYNANHVEGLINLLKCSPNVEALVIRCKEGKRMRWQTKTRKANENRTSWKSRLEDIACLSYHVKIIQISNLGGMDIALELVNFLLQNGKILEKMEITHGSGGRRQNYFSKLPRASSATVISFPEYGPRTIPWFDSGDSDPECDS